MPEGCAERSAFGSHLAATLAVLPPYSALPAEAIAEVGGGSHRRTLHRGDVLWRAGETASSFHVVLSGLLKIVRRDGDEDSIVSIFGPKEGVGDAAIVARGRYPADAIAASQVVVVLVVDGDVVHDAMVRHACFGAAMNRALLRHTEALQEKIRIMSAGSVPRRLATLLLGLAERFGDDLADGSTIVPVVLSRTELARLVGTTVETTIRMMSAWQRKGVVETTGEGFVLRSANDLAEIAHGATSESS